MRDFSIGETSAAVGVGESTLRMWEMRHGFPMPRRLESGHRRYSEADIAALKRALSLRQAGLSLPLAIQRAREPVGRPQSLYATLRAAHPQLGMHRLSRQVLLALTHAVEEETCALAERPLMFGSFQHEKSYRREEGRWKQFAATAALVCVFADFDRVKVSDHQPIEIPIEPGDHLGQEWSVVCDAPGYGVCLSAWEQPRNRPSGRVFETLWSVEPGVVHSATRACAAIARTAIPETMQSLGDRLNAPAEPSVDDQLRLAAAITGRALASVSSPPPL